MPSRASRRHSNPGPLSDLWLPAQSRADKRARLPRHALRYAADPAAGVLSSTLDKHRPIGGAVSPGQSTPR